MDGKSDDSSCCDWCLVLHNGEARAYEVIFGVADSVAAKADKQVRRQAEGAGRQANQKEEDFPLSY